MTICGKTSNNIGFFPLPNSSALIRWIHVDLSDAEFLPILREWRRHSELRPGVVPLAATKGGEMVAGCYFMHLPGNVASLGGLRAVPGHEDVAKEMLIAQTDRLNERGVGQIQAVLSERSPKNHDIVVSAGFSHLATVQHLWREVDLSAARPKSKSPVKHDSELNGLGGKRNVGKAASDRHRPTGWISASNLSRKRFAKLLDRTFIDTLDCPQLNGRRTCEEVMEGFLEDRPLREVPHWYVLRANKPNPDGEPAGENAGCLLLESHQNGVLEIAYLGLLPEFRGCGLGVDLLEKAEMVGHENGLPILAAAVDASNWPAMQNYERFKFQKQQALEVYLLPRDDCHPLSTATVGDVRSDTANSRPGNFVP